MMKKLSLVLLAGVCAASLTACSGSSDTTATTAAATTAAETQAEEEAAETEAEGEEEAEEAGEVFTSMEGPSYTFRCSTNHSESFNVSVALQKWAELVNERTGGRITIDIYYDAVLGDEKSEIEQLQYGGLDFARVSISPVAEFVDDFNALQMPFAFNSNEHFWKVMGGSLGMDMLKGEKMINAGMYGLTYYDGGTRNFYNSKKEIHTPEDMAGMNIRVQESNLMVGMIDALGAVAQPMAYGDVYSALQTGTIDGAENSIVQYLEVSHYEVAPYLTLDDHVRAADLLIMSEKTREQLSEDDMKVIEQAALESWDYQKGLWAEVEEEALDKLAESGVTVTRLTDEEAKLFQDACKEFTASYEGGKYADMLEKIAAEAE